MLRGRDGVVLGYEVSGVLRAVSSAACEVVAKR